MSVTITPALTITVSLAGMTARTIRDSLLSLPNTERTFIVTDPDSGEFKVVSMQRKASGEMEIKYSTVPEP